MRHIIQVLSVNVAALWVAVEHVNDLLTLLSLVSAIGFTVYKFIKDTKK